jgi:hypothetical protein
MKALKDCKPGDVIKFTTQGCEWTVWHKTKPHPAFNTVIQLFNDKGTARTYSSRDRKWWQAVIMIRDQSLLV